MKYLFAAIMFLIGTDTFIVSPLLPTLRAEFGIGADTSGWLVSAYALGYAVTALIAGPLTDRSDRKKVLLAGLAGFALFTGLCGTAAGFGDLFLYRLLSGVFAALAAPQVYASIPQTVSSSQVLRTMGWATAGLSAAQVLGLPLGSLLARESWRFPFYCVGLLTLLVLWLAFRHLPAINPPTAATERVSFAAAYRSLLGRRAARFAFAAHFCYFIGTFGSFIYIGIWMADEFLLDVGQIGWLMMVCGAGNMAGSLWGSKLAERWGSRTLLTISLLIIGAVFAVAPNLHQLPGIGLLLFFSSFAGGQSFPLILSTLQTIDSRLRGTIASLANSVMYLGTTAGSAMAGWIYARFGGFAGVGVMVGIAVLFAIALFRSSGLLGNAVRASASCSNRLVVSNRSTPPLTNDTGLRNNGPS